MLEFFWDLYQQRQIADLQKRSASTPDAEFAARQTVQREVVAVDERLDKMALVMHAMWTLVSERMNISEGDLINRMTELDGQDGAVDGRISKPQVRCGKCDAVVSRKFNRCLFCGEPYADGSALDTI